MGIMKKRQDQIEEWILTQTDFETPDTRPTLRGFWMSREYRRQHGDSRSGKMPREAAHRLHSTLRDSEIYVVRSYDTPIAWFDTNQWAWVIPDVTYSKTTTNHQNLIRRTVESAGFRVLT